MSIAETIEQTTNLGIYIPGYLQARDIKSQAVQRECEQTVKQFLGWLDQNRLTLRQLRPEDVVAFGSSRRGKSQQSIAKAVNTVTGYIAWLYGYEHPAVVARVPRSKVQHLREKTKIECEANSEKSDLDDQLSGEAIEKYLNETYSNRNTINTNRSGLKSFSRWLRTNNKRLDQIMARDVLYFVDHQKWGNRRKCAVCQCIAKYYSIQFGPDHAAAHAKKKRIGPRPQRYLTMDQILQVYEHLSKNSPINIRNRAIFGLMVNAALTEKEIVNLCEMDVDLIRMSVTVSRRGLNKEGIFEGMFSLQTRGDLIAWMNIRKKYALEDNKALFVSANGMQVGGPLSCVTVRGIFEQIGKELGFNFSPQDIRRSFIVISAEHGASLDAIRITGGWADDTYITKTLEKFEMGNYSPMTPRTILETGVQGLHAGYSRSN